VSNLLPNLDDLLTELPGATPGVEDARAIVEAAADETPRPATGSGPDVIALLDGVPLTSDEAGYVEAARAANTMRGYRSDWREVHHLVHPARHRTDAGGAVRAQLRLETCAQPPDP